jgi:SnoaL-like domain
MSQMSAGPLLTAYGTAVADHDWSGLRALLADDATVTLLHTGERLDADGFVAFNRDYPGAWVFHVDEVVGGGRRGVLRAHTVVDQETYHVATFGSLDATGRLTDVVEVWTEAVAPHPERGTP